MSKGPDCPDCIQWACAEVQVEPEPQALSSTSAKGLVLVLILGNSSRLEELMHQGMEKVLI